MTPDDMPHPRKGPRTRDEIRLERDALDAESERAIYRIADEFHALLPRERAGAVGVAYARYSSRFQHSIADQVRGLYEAAVRQGIFIPRENVGYDLAARGCSSRRPGLDRVRDLLASGSVDAFLVFATNRLFRKTYKALQFVEEEVVDQGIRCLFVKSGVDSADERRWKMLLQVNAMTDEFVVGMYADNVRSAHEGLFDVGLVFGTISFGYRGREVPGRPTKRGRPRCALEVDPEAAPWVARAFAWFVEDRLSINEIVRRFNADQAVPPSPRSLSGRWSHKSIRYLLANPRYRGLWRYGSTVNVWQGKKDYSRQIERPEPLREGQWEHLRIVGDEAWHLAQRRLGEKPRPPARAPRDGDRRSRPPLLNGLFFCPTHDRMLYVGGTNGRFMFCKDCQASPEGERPLFSQLNRALALSVTYRALAGLVRGDDGLVAAVVAACRKEAARAQRPDPDRLEALRHEEQRLDRQIKFLLDNAGEMEVDRRESGERLRALRRSRADIAAELARAESDRDRPVVVPTEAEVHALVAELGAILEAAAAGDLAAEAGVAREVIELLTGGRIDLEQCGDRRKHGGWLRGRFRPRLVSALASRSAGVAVPPTADAGEEIVVEYRRPSEAERLGDEVKAAIDRGELIKEAAAGLGISRALATRALAGWYERHGQVMPDGRSRRSTLARKHVEPPKYARLADEAKRLSDDPSLLMEEIGRRLDCDRTTLTRAIAFWYESRGLPVPDGRTRRKTLTRKCGPAWTDGGDGPRVEQASA